MFSKLASFTALAAAISGVLASPVDLSARTSHHQIQEYPSFNDWHGLKSFHGFDDFWGRKNFIGVSKRRVILKQKKELVCRKQEIVIIQQRLVVLQELAKKIITEQICEVEAQTVVFEQFHSGLGFFRHDLSRKSGRHVGYDARITGLWGGLFNHDGSFTDHDLGFRGHHVGKRVIVPTGHNWNDITSPPIIADAYGKAKKAIELSGEPIEDDNIDLSSIETDPDVEVDGAADAPGDDEVDGAEAGDDAGAAGDDAGAADDDAGAADDAAADGDNTAITSTESAPAATGTAASSSAPAAPPAPTESGNIDPATAP